VWIPWRDGVQGFAMPRIDKAAAEMKRTGSGEPAYWDSTLQALCAMALRAETEFARGKAILTATGVAYDKAAINKHIKTLAAEFRARQEQSGVTTVEHAQVISDEQLGEWRIPSGWRVDEEGVWLITEDKPIRVSPVQIVLTARLLCRDDNTEKIRVGFRRDGELKTVDSARSTVFSRAKIVELADFGLPISTETAKNVVRYLHEFEICNFDLLPSKVVTGHFGWFDARNFLPGVNPDGIQFSPAGPGDAQIAAAYREKGEIAEWVQLAAECRKHPFVRAALAGSFAAPLMRDIGFRPFIVYLYGESEGGKSAALALAMSAWGEPEGLKASFNATKTATEKLAHLYSDLPLWLDERQVVDRTERGRQMVDALMYIITQGRGRGRGSKGGGLQTFSTWRTVALTCGEDPIVETETATGVRVRAIELFGKPFEGDDALARRVYEVTAQHHGLAGPEFIKRYLAEKTDILAGYEHALKYISERYGKKLHGTHTTVLAILMVADMASAMWIFGQDEDDAFKSAEQWINVIAQEMVQARNEGDWAYRAMEFTRSWIAQNWDKFNHKYDDLKEHWGWTDNEENDTIAPDTIYIFPAALQSALQKQGFSPGRARREWAKRGWIEVDEASKQTTVVKRVPWLGKAQRVIALKNVDAGESSE
jgi:putative DNA primase/helicase